MLLCITWKGVRACSIAAHAIRRHDLWRFEKIVQDAMPRKSWKIEEIIFKLKRWCMISWMRNWIVSWWRVYPRVVNLSLLCKSRATRCVPFCGNVDENWSMFEVREGFEVDLDCWLRKWRSVDRYVTNNEHSVILRDLKLNIRYLII